MGERMIALALTGLLVQAPSPHIPVRPGLVVVHAVEGDADRGDYEATIQFTSVTD